MLTQKQTSLASKALALKAALPETSEALYTPETSEALSTLGATLLHPDLILLSLKQPQLSLLYLLFQGAAPNGYTFGVAYASTFAHLISLLFKHLLSLLYLL